MKPGYLKGIYMNALYHIAILEGYLAQHAELPRNVQDAIAFFKQGSASTESVSAAITKKPRKKMKLNPEQRMKNLENLARMRDIAAQNREQRKRAIWTPERKAKVSTLRAEGKGRQEIARLVGVSITALDTAVSNFDL